MDCLPDTLIKSLFSEYGLAVTCLFFFISYLIWLIKALALQRIADREERKEMLKAYVEQRKKTNQIISDNTQSINALKASVAYLTGRYDGGRK